MPFYAMDLNKVGLFRLYIIHASLEQNDISCNDFYILHAIRLLQSLVVYYSEFELTCDEPKC